MEDSHVVLRLISSNEGEVKLIKEANSVCENKKENRIKLATASASASA